jgi:hypothetical protein
LDRIWRAGAFADAAEWKNTHHFRAFAAQRTHLPLYHGVTAQRHIDFPQPPRYASKA